ncbi:baseplate J/gp47 family protein [Bacillus sp. FJAT-49736]|uniref:baseplate J/gp47 family protein n=1 Tax=Bacillus sp. FJAT-49736 TaxID=2833582 RepID=UPI001BC9C1E3|nr:baseplate J/gp47 family protein [Bacillus sp. FJAT-49736]
MYEHMTFDYILDNLLSRVSDKVDKREGSIIYDALAPAAAELAQLYMELDININLSYADTADGEFLDRRVNEHGIYRSPATKAQRKGLFYGENGTFIDIPIGSRFSINDLTYTVLSKLTAGQYILEPDDSGVIGNQHFGTLLPIDYIEGLVSAELSDVLIPGEDEEDDESLRVRFLTEKREPPFGGNIADYKRKINNINGIGGVKVFPTWQGGGTVKCTIISSDFSKPSAELINDVQTIMDPEINKGQGLGMAPIGHTVTIAGVENKVVDVVTKITLSADYTIGQIEPQIIEILKEYFLSLRKSWANEDQLVVRIAQIDAKILTIPGIIDVENTQLNGVNSNVIIQSEEIPIMGQVLING